MDVEKNYLNNLNILKILMILAVVLGHCTNGFTNGWVLNLNINSNFCRYISVYLNSFHMQILVFISGAIYYYCRIKKRKYLTFTELIKNKFKRLVVPYIVIGGFYMIPIWKILNLKPGSYMDNIWTLLLGKEFGYVWFLIMLFSLFIIFYLIERFILTKYITLNILLFIIMSFFSGYCISIFKINRAVSYLLYFYIGYLSYQYITDVNNIFKHIYKFKYIIIPLNTILIGLLINFQNIIPYIRILTAVVKFIIPMIIVILALIKFYIISIDIISSLNNKVIKYLIKLLQKYSFGIYLLHEPIIMIILNHSVNNIKNLNIVLIVLFCFFISIFLSITINKLYLVLKNKIFNVIIKRRVLNE